MSNALVIGAGKIARGFIGQLLHLSGFEITFVDACAPLVSMLNERGAYRVHVMGDESLDTEVTGFSALDVSDLRGIGRAFLTADIVFVSVGGDNLLAAGTTLARALAEGGIGDRPRDIIACENWRDAGDTLRHAIRAHLPRGLGDAFDTLVGVSEAVMMRTATQPDEQLARERPLDVWVQNFWCLPIDRARLKAPFPEIRDVKLLDDFGSFLTQKMYTNNTSNAVIAYTGYLRGYEYLADAANSPEIQGLLDDAYACINATLEAELGVDPRQQRELSEQARAKYVDYTIVDRVVRHARDPLRKLGPQDRLIAPCRMALSNGIDATVLIDTVAKAIFFDEPGDESARRLRAMRREHGIGFVLTSISELDEHEPLYRLVLDGVGRIRQAGLVTDHE